MDNAKNDFFKSNVLGHPAGLFVLFFTEMWERFSFYGMRVLLVNFLTMALVGYNPGWEWTAENAAALFGTYAMLLYITPIVGGIIADKLIGYRWAVVIGALIMTLGHASMALETEFSLYAGLALLVLGTGFFKPNITSIISEMYKDVPEKKDGAFTIFYMGVNAGAFFGMMLCGYLAERVGWSWGFGLAGIFMLLGTLQFWLAKPLFGSIGEVPAKGSDAVKIAANKTDIGDNEEPPNPFTKLDQIFIVIASVLGIGYAINDPLSKIGGINLFPFELGGLEGQYVAVLIGLGFFLYMVTSRISRYTKIVRDRMIAVIVFAFFTVFFWMSFEQGATSLVLFARDSVDRVLSGGAATAYNIVNGLLTVVPLLFVSWVLFLLNKQTYKKIPGSNIVLAICFLGVWGIVGWMLNRDMNTVAYGVSYDAIETTTTSRHLAVVGADSTTTTIYAITRGKDAVELKRDTTITTVKTKVDHDVTKDTTIITKNYKPITEETKLIASDMVVPRETKVAEPLTLTVGQEIKIITKNNEGTEFGYLDEARLVNAYSRGKELDKDNGVIQAQVTEIKDNEVEITVSWFSILNSFFIIVFASLFSKWWESKYNPSAAVKYGLGLIIMAVGFGLLAWGSTGAVGGAKVSMVWLILAYLFHTLGELCLSPVGLSYVSKLVPPRMIAFMFGMWYLAIAIGNKLAAVLGGQIESITEQYSLSTFFLIFTIVPTVAGLLIIALSPVLKKLMHGVK